jgi:hypothetical protein
MATYTYNIGRVYGGEEEIVPTEKETLSARLLSVLTQRYDIV